VIGGEDEITYGEMVVKLFPAATPTDRDTSVVAATRLTWTVFDQSSVTLQQLFGLRNQFTTLSPSVAPFETPIVLF